VGGIDFLGGGPSTGGVERDEGELGTLSGKGVGEADAATGSSDDDSFSCKLGHGGSVKAFRAVC